MTTQNFIDEYSDLLQDYSGYDNNTDKDVVRHSITEYNKLYVKYKNNYSDTFTRYNIEKGKGHGKISYETEYLLTKINPLKIKLNNLLNNRNNIQLNNTQPTTQQPIQQPTTQQPTIQQPTTQPIQQNNNQQPTTQLDDEQLDDEQLDEKQLDDEQLDDEQLEDDQQYNYYFSFIMLLTACIMITLNIFLIFFMKKSKVLYEYQLDENINIIYIYK